MKAIDKVKYFISKSLNVRSINQDYNEIKYFNNHNFKLFTVLNKDSTVIRIPAFFRNNINIDKIKSLNSSINFLVNLNLNFIRSFKTIESIMMSMVYNNTLTKYQVKDEVLKIGNGLILNGENTVLFMVEDVIEKDRYSTVLRNVYFNKLVFNNKGYINDFIANKIYKLLICEGDDYAGYTQSNKINIIITEDIPFILDLNSNETINEINTNCNKILNKNIDLLINSLSNQLIQNEEDIPF